MKRKPRKLIGIRISNKYKQIRTSETSNFFPHFPQKLIDEAKQPRAPTHLCKKTGKNTKETSKATTGIYSFLQKKHAKPHRKRAKH